MRYEDNYIRRFVIVLFAASSNHLANYLIKRINFLKFNRNYTTFIFQMISKVMRLYSSYANYFPSHIFILLLYWLFLAQFNNAFNNSKKSIIININLTLKTAKSDFVSFWCLISSYWFHASIFVEHQLTRQTFRLNHLPLCDYTRFLHIHVASFPSWQILWILWRSHFSKAKFYSFNFFYYSAINNDCVFVLIKV